MTINPDDLTRQLCSQLCASVRVVQRPDGQLMLSAGFVFPDGDAYPIYLSQVLGGIRLSDNGNTLMRISYDHDIDAFITGSRGQLIERIAAEEGVAWEKGVFFVDTPIDRLSEGLFRYGQAVTRVFSLTLGSVSSAGSTFYEDLADLISQSADPGMVQRDYLIPDLPNSDRYPVDYRFEGKHSDHLFLYGVPNRDKARLIAVYLAHFLRHQLDFDSIIVFKNQEEIPRIDLAILSDVGGEMISSLGSGNDLQRKITRRIEPTWILGAAAQAVRA